MKIGAPHPEKTNCKSYFSPDSREIKDSGTRAPCCVPAPSTAPRPSWPAAPGLRCVWPTGLNPAPANAAKARAQPSATHRCQLQTRPSRPRPRRHCRSWRQPAVLNTTSRKATKPTKNPASQQVLAPRLLLTGLSLSAHSAKPCGLSFQARPADVPATAASNLARRQRHETKSRPGATRLNEH